MLRHPRTTWPVLEPESSKPAGWARCRELPARFSRARVGVAAGRSDRSPRWHWHDRTRTRGRHPLVGANSHTRWTSGSGGRFGARVHFQAPTVVVEGAADVSGMAEWVVVKRRGR